MPLLQVREFPAALYELLSLAAKSQNRSITQQTIHMLSQDLQYSESKDQLRRKKVLYSLEQNPLCVAESAPDYTALIRADRDRKDGYLS